MEHFSHVKLYVIFLLLFLYKKISGNSTPLTQKERCLLKRPQISFLREPNFAVSHSSDFTRDVKS